MSEPLFDPDDLEIIHDKVYAFPYPEHLFTVEYSTNDKEWSAYHYDVNVWEDTVILQNKDLRFEEIRLFDAHTLTVKEFEGFQEFVEKDLE